MSKYVLSSNVALNEDYFEKLMEGNIRDDESFYTVNNEWTYTCEEGTFKGTFVTKMFQVWAPQDLNSVFAIQPVKMFDTFEKAVHAVTKKIELPAEIYPVAPNRDLENQEEWNKKWTNYVEQRAKWVKKFYELNPVATIHDTSMNYNFAPSQPKNWFIQEAWV
jgi:hypothetical protein